jgi:hypothetical protein
MGKLYLCKFKVWFSIYKENYKKILSLLFWQYLASEESVIMATKIDFVDVITDSLDAIIIA